MKELLKRAITGAVYVFLLLSAVFLKNKDAFDFVFLVFGLICLYEFKKIIKLSGYYIFILFLLIWWLFIYVYHNTKFYWIFLIPTLLVNCWLLLRLFSKKPSSLNNVKKFLISLFYIGGGAIFLAQIPYKNGVFSEFLIFGIFLLVWVNDTFAYITGRLLGKHKLFERVSPKKTIEGSIGGFLFSMLAAYMIAIYTNELPVLSWMILAMVVVLFGSLGDLVESFFKRNAKVKDSGAILPGHGGLLDRLDSLIFAAPFVYITIQILTYVS